MKKTEIWDSHVHLFPPEIYENWEKYAARDNWFALLTKKPENGKGTEEAWANAEEALDCAEKAGIYGLVIAILLIFVAPNMFINLLKSVL